jgi:hypothetical protein
VVGQIGLIAPGGKLAGPLPAPPVVTAVMMMAHPSGTKAATTVRAGWGYALGRQHDHSMGPYHFAANTLLPLVWLLD